MQNLLEAREWFQKSADQGDVSAKFFQAMMANQRPEDPFDFQRGVALLNMEEFFYAREAFNLLRKLTSNGKTTSMQIPPYFRYVHHI